MQDWIVPLVLFVIGWVFAVIDNGWRSPILWVVSALTIAVAIPLLR